jgi:hypothetical protein
VNDVHDCLTNDDLGYPYPGGSLAVTPALLTQLLLALLDAATWKSAAVCWDSDLKIMSTPSNKNFLSAGTCCSGTLASIPLLTKMWTAQPALHNRRSISQIAIGIVDANFA